MRDPEQKKHMPIDEFRTLGYMLEANRNYLHPLGLALCVHYDEHGEAIGLDVQDYREDPEGMAYAEIDASDVARAERIAGEAALKAAARLALYGWVVQPPIVGALTL